MIVIDWANYEETVIILRVEGECSKRDYQLVSLQYDSILMDATASVAIIIDIRRGEKSLSKIFQFLDKQMKSYKPALNKIVVISSSKLDGTMRILENFYPELASNIIVTSSVDDAYEIVDVA